MSRSSRPARPDDPPPSSDERRASTRYAVEWAVDCLAEATFLYAEITNISQMGIFVSCSEPFEVGTLLKLKFSSPESGEFSLFGRVQWVNRSQTLRASKNPGMGICFVDLSRQDRERIVTVVHTIAYLRNLSN